MKLLLILRPPLIASMLIVSPVVSPRLRKIGGVPPLLLPSEDNSVRSVIGVVSAPSNSGSLSSTVPSAAIAPPELRLPANVAFSVALAIVKSPTGILMLVGAPAAGTVKVVKSACKPCTRLPVAGLCRFSDGLRLNVPSRLKTCCPRLSR